MFQITLYISSHPCFFFQISVWRHWFPVILSPNDVIVFVNLHPHFFFQFPQGYPLLPSPVAVSNKHQHISLWQSSLELLSWCPIFKSSHCNSSEDREPVDFIYGCQILKWIAETWLYDREPGQYWWHAVSEDTRAWLDIKMLSYQHRKLDGCKTVLSPQWDLLYL